MNYEDFLKISKGLCLPETLFLNQMEAIEDFLERVERQDESTENILEKIESNVNRKLGKLNDRTILFAGGGVDSTYLLLKAAELNKEVDALSFVTGENETGLKLVDDICHKIGAKHYKLKENLRDLDFQLQLFIAQEGRPPRDPVAPLVSLMTKRAKDLGFTACLDGQFADTIFFANPQNNLFARTAKLPKIPLMRGFTTHVNLQHKSTKFRQLRCYLSLNCAQKLLFLSRVEITQATEDVVSRLLTDHHPQHVLQSIFWFVLLQNRERDKYVCNHIPICSPFDDSDLFLLMCKETTGIGKRYLRSYVEKRIPGAKSRVRSESFRPTT